MKMKLLYLPIAVGMLAAGCSKFKDFGDTNVDPSGITVPITSALLTNVEAGIAGWAASTRGALYGQYFSETQYTDVSLYSLPQVNFGGNYSGSLYDLQNIIIQNTNAETKVGASVNGSNNNQIAIARILKSYIFWRMTDQWGDIPYSEALQGKTNSKLDPQENIYKGIITELTQAVAQFDNLGTVKGDIIFNGDNAKWKKAANSLRLLMALQLSKRYPTAAGYSATEFKAALADAGGVITTNADNWAVKYPGGTFKSPWWGLYDGRKDYGESKTIIDILGTLGDARQTKFGTSTVGVPYGLARSKAEAFTAANPTWSYVLQGLSTPQDGSVIIISAAQVSLARAEAADRGWTAENVTNFYQGGITLSFQQFGLAAPAASYFTQASVALGATGTGANVGKIATQEWIASYPDGLTAWNIWRRTGFPALTPAPDAVNSSKQIPRRLVYGTSDYATNKENVTAAAARLTGGDTQDSRIWWDQ